MEMRNLKLAAVLRIRLSDLDSDFSLVPVLFPILFLTFSVPLCLRGSILSLVQVCAGLHGVEGIRG